MTMQATIKTVENIYSPLRELSRTILEIEGVDEPFVAYGREAENIVKCTAGSRVLLDSSSDVNLIGKGNAHLIDHINVI